MYMNKPDLAFNNQQMFICHKAKPNQANQDQRGPGGNGNEGLLHTPQIPRTEASSPKAV